MKKIINCTILVLLFGIVGCTKLVDLDKTMTEVQNEIRKAYEIWETKDINSVKEIYAGNAVVFGTLASEYFNGIDEIEATYKANMPFTSEPNFTFKNEIIHISPSGDMASFSHKLVMTFTSQGEASKLEDRSMNRYLNDEEYKKSIVEYTELEASGSNF